MKKNFCIILLIAFLGRVGAQIKVIDTTINNLVHKPGYITGEYGAIPQFVKAGMGKKTMILIPGVGFDASVFDDFIKANKVNYTMYTITIPGYGKTKAPPMPLTNASYGEQNWNKGVIEGLLKLIEKEKLTKPFIVGHFVQGTQLALRFAIDHPDKISGAIILGGPAKFVAIVKGEPVYYPLKSSITYIDNNLAPQWFKPISQNDFNDGNYLPVIYSLDSLKGQKLWNQVASINLPVMIRYLCEFFSSDISLEFEKIKCPVLVLRATFNEKLLQDPTNNYVVPQFIKSWADASTKNPLIQVTDVPNSAAFVWNDNPSLVYKLINDFISKQ